jgi:type IV secretion system protein VirB10
MTDTATASSEGDVRPVVGRKVSNRGLWIFGIALALAAGLLFGALEARRMNISSPAVSVPATSGAGVIAPPPELAIPLDFDRPRYRIAAGYPDAAPGPQPATAVVITPRSAPAPAYPPLPSVYSGPASYPDSPASAPPAPGYVFQASAPAPKAPGEAAGTRAKDERARASRLTNPATTVPQGTVIQAVLETALNSNHPGFARAVVSRDVSSFDGSRVLIPKGSKLFGEYKADVSLGQNRALIQWHRLTRPDGSIIDVDSPTADPLGRIGVRGKVDTHFFQRFAGSILQSVLDIGVQLAARQADDTVVLALPNSTQNITPVQPDQIRPTVKVRQGTSVSVFVARDLDFTDVEG